MDNTHMRTQCLEASLMLILASLVSPNWSPTIEAHTAVSSRPDISPQHAFIFTAPPRETVADGKKDEPTAALLTRATGEKFAYEHPDNWLT